MIEWQAKSDDGSGENLLCFMSCSGAEKSVLLWDCLASVLSPAELSLRINLLDHEILSALDVTGRRSIIVSYEGKVIADDQKLLSCFFLVLQLFHGHKLRETMEKFRSKGSQRRHLNYLADDRSHFSASARRRVKGRKFHYSPLWISPNVRRSTSVFTKATDLKLLVKAEWKLFMLAFRVRLKLFRLFISILSISVHKSRKKNFASAPNQRKQFSCCFGWSRISLHRKKGRFSRKFFPSLKFKWKSFSTFSFHTKW